MRCAMYKYPIDKKIEELDPIPSSWSDASVKQYIDSGLLAISGQNPQDGIYQTKKLSIDELYNNLSTKNSVLVAKSEPMNQNGAFYFNPVDGRSAGTSIEIVNGKYILPPGWYHYDAIMTITYTGQAINRIEPISLVSNKHGHQNTCVFDFSVEGLQIVNSLPAHVETVTLSGALQCDNGSSSEFYLSIQGIPSGINGFKAETVISVATIRNNDVTT